MGRYGPPEPYEDPRTAGPLAAPQRSKRRRVEATPAGGVAVKSPHLRIAKGVTRRRPHEMQAVRYMTSIKLDVISAEVLKLHAYQRHVAQSVLISDILNLWLGAATDYGQALFREMLPTGARAADVPERWAGYLASLGFAPSTMPQETPIPSVGTAPPLPDAPAHSVPPPRSSSALAGSDAGTRQTAAATDLAPPEADTPPGGSGSKQALPALEPGRLRRPGAGRKPLLQEMGEPSPERRPAPVRLQGPAQPLEGRVPPEVVPQVRYDYPARSARDAAAVPARASGPSINLGFTPSAADDAPLKE